MAHTANITWKSDSELRDIIASHPSHHLRILADKELTGRIANDRRIDAALVASGLRFEDPARNGDVA